MKRSTHPGDRRSVHRVSCAECLSRAAGIFSALEGNDLLQLDATRTSRLYKKGETLYSEGDQLQSYYCVRSGRVRIFKTTGKGQTLILRIAGPGEVLGLESVVVQKRATSGAQMLEVGVVCATDRKVVLELIRKDPRTAGRVIDTLASRLRDSDEERLALARLTVRERMARLLLLFAQSFGVPGQNGFPIPLGLTRQDLAELVGTAPETLIRALREFRDEGILEASRREITILDKRRLVRTAGLSEKP